MNLHQMQRPYLTPSYHVGDGIVVKNSKGRATSRNVPVDSVKWNERERPLFNQERLGENVA